MTHYVLIASLNCVGSLIVMGGALVNYYTARRMRRQIAIVLDAQARTHRSLAEIDRAFTDISKKVGVSV
jgi:hypothetical protein